MKKRFLHFAAALLLGGATLARAQESPLQAADDLRAAPALQAATRYYTRYQVYRLDAAALQAQLTNAPLEFTGGQPVLLTLPLPQGGTATLKVVDSPVLAPALQAQNPNLKTYSVQAVSGPITGRLSFLNGVLSVVLFDADQGREVYFQHLTLPGQPQAYLGYSTGDVRLLPRTGPNALKSACGTEGGPPSLHTGVPGARSGQRTGATLRTYRLAVCTTTNFTLRKGIPAGTSTPAAGLAGLLDFVNVLKGIYRRELSVDFTLVSNTNTITTATNSPNALYNDSTASNLPRSQAFLDAQVGNGNYDIGHLVDAAAGITSGGGIAAKGSLCKPTTKGEGVSAVNEGDPLSAFPRVYGDQVFAHEVGHQFGMDHTFNSSIPVCTTREAGSSVEPGSGTTLMSYGYTCSNTSAPKGPVGNDDYEAPGAPNGLPYLNFHTVSLAEANAYQAANSCGTSASTGTGVPTVGMVTTGNFIPKSTPFMLSGTASGGGGGALSYSWEGTDPGATPNGSQVAPTELDDPSKAPFFRSYAPQPTGQRTFPILSAILNGTNQAKGDKLPSVGRVVNLRLTVRDGQFGVDEMNSAITVDGNSGPFLVTSNLAGSYAGGQSQTVTWSVNNTTAAPVSCANVDILLSVDGGQTFPYTLAAATLNDGTEAVAMPYIATATTQARLKVQATGNIFFDISNADFALAAGTAPTAQLAVTQGTTSYPSGGATYTFPTQAQGTTSAPVTFTLTNAGSAPLAITSIVVNGSYALSGAAPTTVAAGGTATVAVTFTPLLNGANNPGTITITTSLGTYVVNLAGTGTAPTTTILNTDGTSATSYCAGSTGSVTYSSNAPFTAGNVFTVQLSDANGSFAAPTTVGTLTSTAGNGSIPVTIPAGLSGTAFRFRVNSSAPTLTGNPDNANITIRTQPVATFSYGTGSSFCTSQTTAQTVTLGTGASAGTFTSTTGLSVNATTGAINLTASTPGTYTVTNTVAAGSGCSAATATSTVTITAPQSAIFSYPLQPGVAIYCAGASAPVAATLGTGAAAGTFSVVPGTSTGATINATTGALNLSGATAGSFTVTNTLPASGACAASTDAQTVTVQPVPATPVLVAHGAPTTGITLNAPLIANATYLFYRGTTLVANGRDNHLFINSGTQNGSYTVVVVSNAGCTSPASNAVTVTVTATATAQATAASLALYPNPAAANGTIVAELQNWPQPATLTLLNALGEVVRTVADKATGTTRVDLTGLAAGVYWLRAQAAGQQRAQRLVVQ